MNKAHAEIIVETIDKKQLIEMLNNAKEQITDWKAPSKVNLSATIGTSWNILTHDIFNPEYLFPIGRQTKLYLIWEFGDYLPEDLKIKIHRCSKSDKELVHQEPIFNDSQN